MATRPTQTPAVVETQLVHDVHRRATSLLVAVLSTPPPLPSAAGELRHFVVAALEHHHHSEDTDLWPLLRRAAPTLSDELDSLSREHHWLDRALAELGGADLDEPGDGRPLRAAVAVRDLVHAHLDHEEPVLFPALRTHLSDDDWTGFSQRTVASTPEEVKQLMVGFLHEVGEPSELAVIFQHLPPEARDALPVVRRQAESVLASLRRSAAATGR